MRAAWWLLGRRSPRNFAIGGPLISFLGALILLAIVNLIRRGRPR
jgi:uncharacterized membrane protein YeaQ/YmgE (transglycosylase-associated protein family)